MERAEQWGSSAGVAYVALASRRARDFYLALGYEDSAVFFRKILDQLPGPPAYDRAASARAIGLVRTRGGLGRLRRRWIRDRWARLASDKTTSDKTTTDKTTSDKACRAHAQRCRSSFLAARA
jgi:hypothetical protein